LTLMQTAISGFFSWAVLGLPAFLFVITLVVFFHELGHFLVARWCGVAVEVFSIGFGREIVGFNDRKGTRWRLSVLPLGGYVKFSGDADAASRPDAESLSQMDAQARKDALHFKPLYQRALVAAAGPFANFILAVFIFAGLALALGKLAEPPIIDKVLPNLAAQKAGLQTGDMIRSVDGQSIRDFADVVKNIEGKLDETVHMIVTRGGHDLSLDMVPTARQVTDDSGAKRTVGQIGISPASVSVGLVEAFQIGIESTWIIFRETLTYLVKIATGQE